MSVGTASRSTIIPKMPSSRAASRRSSTSSRYQAPSSEAVHLTTAAEILDGTRPITGGSKQLGLAELVLTRQLWAVGDVTVLRAPAVAIIGTREVSAEGAARARRLARELAAVGVVVVSGLARGVDTEALQAAIDVGGRVTAVIGTSVDRAYPAENASLQQRIGEQHLLLSPFAPGSRVFQSNFPDRNRMMAALTDASVIVEAGETSGTLHQAAECVKLGRLLFILKSVVDDKSLTWPARFVGQPNVYVLTSSAEVIAALGIPR